MEDRSPSAMRSHIKAQHDTGVGGLYHKLEEKMRLAVPHKYTHRMDKGEKASKVSAKKRVSNASESNMHVFDSHSKNMDLSPGKFFRIKTTEQ